MNDDAGDRCDGDGTGGGSDPVGSPQPGSRRLPLQLGDVQQVIRWTLIASITVNIGDLYFAGDSVTALLSAVCVAALLIDRRVGAAVTTIIYLLTLHSSHEFLIMSIAVILTLFPSPRQMALLLKVQITVMWVFTGISKFHPNFRSGEVFSRGPLLIVDRLPVDLVIWATIAAELVILPVLLWWKPKIAFWAALVFQTAVFLGMIRFMAARSFAKELSFQLSLLSFEIAVMGAVLVATLLNPRGAGAEPAARRAHAR